LYPIIAMLSFFFGIDRDCNRFQGRFKTR
jgi:hypothetical protein